MPRGELTVHTIGTSLTSAAFVIVIVMLLMIDLGIFHRRAHAVSLKEALSWTAVWASLSICFGGWVYRRFGTQPALEFFAGYLIEYALSVDNVFVFILIFSYFKVPSKLHHKVLFWGIIGALAMRATFILSGAALIRRFEWILYLFGIFLIYTGFKMFRGGDTEVDPGKNPIVRRFQKVVPMVADYGSARFFVRQAGRLFATPLALVLITVETTDLMFATDSIPAIFGVTTDPFIVYTSNVFAILGLRSMYFLLAAVIERFAYLGAGVAIVLMFVGVKMLLAGFYQIPIAISLAIVALLLSGSVLLSIARPPRNVLGSSKSKDSLITSDKVQD
jgi:tellurite resistance protein TerC